MYRSQLYAMKKYILFLLIGFLLVFVITNVYNHTVRYNRQIYLIEKMSNIVADSKNRDKSDIDIRLQTLRNESTSIHNDIYQLSNIICLVLTRPLNNARQLAITRTWGNGCNRLFFVKGNMSIESARELPVDVDGAEATNKFRILLVKVNDSYGNTWAKVRAAFKYVYEQCEKNGCAMDWLFRVDDDAYVIMDNLRLMLRHYDATTQAIQFGAHMRVYVRNGYIVTGPGIAISRRAFVQLMANFEHNNCGPDKVTHGDDVLLGECLQMSNVTVGDSSDARKRLRFLQFEPISVMFRQKTDSRISGWLKSYSAYPLKPGIECCSDDAIAFHYLSAEEIELFHFLLTRSNPYYKAVEHLPITKNTTK